jgi:predicted O-linked N-acetylglucosamine transferase (SPINDLY family)
MTVDQLFESALAHHRAGCWMEAEKFCRQILSQNHDHIGALHVMGLILARGNRLDEAIQFLQRAIALSPDNAVCYVDLSAVFTIKKQLSDAIDASRRAVAIKPDLAEAYRNLANALKDSGQTGEAIIAAREAIRLKPEMATAHAILGDALNRTGEHDEAIAAFQKCLALQPTLAIARVNLGVALADKGQFDDAIAEYQRAISLQPNMPEAHNNLGSAWKEKGKSDDAIAAYRQAIRIKPDFADAHSNLGVMLKDKWQLDEALPYLERATQLSPTSAEVHNNLGGGLNDLGRLHEAIASYRRALELKPDFAEAHSNLLFTLTSLPDLDAQAIFAEHRAWAERHTAGLSGQTIAHENNRSPDRRLRIGYLSPDFRRHSVGYFLLWLLERHDHKDFEIFGYSNVQRPDDFTERMKRSCDGWRNIRAMKDAAVADLIRRDGIDILVDLAGHTAGGRPLVLARKPAPIQVTYLGYANTTGIAAIDYRLTDALVDPPGQADALNVEKLWRLPTCAWCYHPPDEAPDVQAHPAGPVTFGCFNAFAKINEKTISLWAELLNRVPTSRLLLKSAGAGQESSRKRLTAQFAELGISSDRIEMLGRTPDARDHMKLYGRVDVALDTYPYHGTTTTCEALWMGVPVVTLAGHTHVSRVGVSLLTSAGLPELIAQSAEDYLRIAASLADDLPRLIEIRQTLRAKLRVSALMDGVRFTSDMESAYRRMWRAWCARA